MSSVAELEQEIRDFINAPRRQHALLQDTASWNCLCSSLDTIGDTGLAIAAYGPSAKANSEGAAYLLVYGILQALFIQQDAVENMCKALQIDYVLDSSLKEVREIRNDSIGHPTKRGAGKGNAYNFISRSILTTAGFNLMTTYPDSRPPLFRYIGIPTLIKTQSGILKRVLTEGIEKLKREEAEHRAKFRDERLQDVFPAALGYFFQKIAEAIHRDKPREFGTAHINLVAETVECFKGKLQERGILDAYDSVLYLLQLIDYPIAELSAYFGTTRDSSLNEKGAYIFAYFLEKQIEELRGIAEEIDRDYAAEP
ncbi:MAG: hypothetical protein P1P84_07850 [Deferrisomatales bacterium]|nr:hypothetical protein [Deferrisomatales bacterium]